MSTSNCEVRPFNLENDGTPDTLNNLNYAGVVRNRPEQYKVGCIRFES